VQIVWVVRREQIASNSNLRIDPTDGYFSLHHNEFNSVSATW
jgi:hypothetical protein